jgi:hypothetical protein
MSGNPPTNPSTPGGITGLSPREAGMIVAIIAVSILAGTQIAINISSTQNIDYTSEAGQQIAEETVRSNNQLFTQLVGASFVVLGLGGGAAISALNKRLNGGSNPH